MLDRSALASAAGSVEVLLNHAGNPSVRTNNGLTPFLLAKSLGWKQTIKVLEVRESA